MYIEYQCPPRAPIANLVSVIKRDIQYWAEQHNISYTVTGDALACTVRVTFNKASHITFFLMSFTPRNYTTSWRRVINVHTV